MNDIAICGKDIRFCRMLELELEAMGYTVIMTRNDDTFVSLDNRITHHMPVVLNTVSAKP